MKRVSFLTLALALILSSNAAAQAVRSNTAQVQDEESAMQTFWIFLTTGKSVADVPQEEVATMQQAHLANFGRLAQAGKLLTAGPMRDPEGTLRGIVVIKAKDAAALAEMFEPDPYVTNGYMKIVSQPCELSIGRFTANLNEQGLDELRIAVVTAASKSDAWPASDELGKLAAAEDVSLAMSAEFKGEGARRGVLIFKSTEDDKIKAALDGLPMFEQGELSYVLMPQYLGKGAIEKGAIEKAGE